MWWKVSIVVKILLTGTPLNTHFHNVDRYGLNVLSYKLYEHLASCVYNCGSYPELPPAVPYINTLQLGATCPKIQTFVLDVTCKTQSSTLNLGSCFAQEACPDYFVLPGETTKESYLSYIISIYIYYQFWKKSYTRKWNGRFIFQTFSVFRVLKIK